MIDIGYLTAEETAELLRQCLNELPKESAVAVLSEIAFHDIREALQWEQEP